MNEQFDRALRNHIRDTFDHYDDLMADDGWKKFQQQKNKKKRGLIFWYGLPSGIAAALAILWLFNLSTNEVVKAHKQNNLAQNQVSAEQQPLGKITDEKSDKVASTEVYRKSTASSIAINHQSNRFLKQEKTSVEFPQISERTERPQISTVNTADLYVADFAVEPKQNELSAISPVLATRNAEKINNQAYLAFNTALLKNTTDDVEPALSKEKQAEKKKDSKFNFAVDANSYYSFTSGGVANDLNLGVGIVSELKLSQRLSINSGISINRQTANYQNSPGISNQDQAILASPNGSSSSLNKESFSVPKNVRTNAKLVGFDIPINLKYNLPTAKFRSFITGGISSYSLLNQSYANDVSVVNYSLTSAPTTTILRNVEQESDGAFSNFQFARTLNFSFGILYPVSTKNSISVEPFVKYPITGFGNQDLEIGSGGISFKLNFGK